MRYKNISLVIGGTMLLAFGTAVFILPFELIAGGISGIALLLGGVIPAHILSPDDMIALLSWSLFLLGKLTLGKDFSRKTFLSTVIYPMGLFLFRPLAGSGLWDLQALWGYESSLLLASVFGGICVGMGCALSLFGGGSTGGIDILALMLSRNPGGIPYEKVIFTIDATVIILGFLIHQNLRHSLLGILCAAITALSIGQFFSMTGYRRKI